VLLSIFYNFVVWNWSDRAFDAADVG